MKTRMKYLFILIGLLLLYGCSQTKTEDPLKIDPRYTNQQIMLYSSHDYNTYKTKDVISAEIWNLSGNVVKFSNDYNIKIFEKTNDGWEEIAEKDVTRLPIGDFEFDPNDGSSNIHMIGIFPDLPEESRTYSLRIYVSGKMMEDNKDVEVTAYVDVTLKP